MMTENQTPRARMARSAAGRSPLRRCLQGFTDETGEPRSIKPAHRQTRFCQLENESQEAYS